MRAELINSSGARARARRSRPYGSGSSPGRAEAPFLFESFNLNGWVARCALPRSGTLLLLAYVSVLICSLRDVPCM